MAAPTHGEAAGRRLDLLWLTWWLGDATGALIVTPVVVLWSSPAVFAWPQRPPLEGMIVLGLLVLISQVVFGNLAPVPVQHSSLELLFVPTLTWAAVRLGPRRVAATLAWGARSRPGAGGRGRRPPG